MDYIYYTIIPEHEWCSGDMVKIHELCIKTFGKTSYFIRDKLLQFKISTIITKVTGIRNFAEMQIILFFHELKNFCNIKKIIATLYNEGITYILESIYPNPPTVSTVAGISIPEFPVHRLIF